MSRWRSVVGAVGAIVVGVVIVVGVPVLLVLVVGNPWPGRARLEMGDEVAVVVGVLTVLAWCVWARFVLAVVVELRHQVAEVRAMTAADRRVVMVPPVARQGIGLVAQRLVAAALVLLPVSAKAVMAIGQAPPPQLPDRVTEQPVSFATSAPVTPPPQASVGTADVTVGPGDTLIRLARAHLGDADRWREIFELNRDRLQPDGHRLASPSGLRHGWRLALPATAADEEAPTPYLAPATITVEAGDNLWDLAEERLLAAGVSADDGAVADHVRVVIAENADVVEDPNLIYVGEQFDFPAVGSPPPPEPETAPAPPPLASEPAPPANGDAPIVEPPVEAAVPPTTTPVPATTTSAVTTSTTTTEPPVAPPQDVADPGAEADPAPAPIGIGEAALLSAGVMALVVARRRMRLRASQPRARVPEPPPDTVATERRLRSVNAGERLLRVDVGVRAAAASLADGPARIAVVRVGNDGTVELTLTGPAVLPAPWKGSFEHWVLSGATPIELLAEAARTVGAPCVALTQLGVDADDRELLVDLEALGLLSIDAAPEQADAVVRGIAATLGTSIFAEVANLIGVGVDVETFLNHPHAQHVAAVDEALELATTLVGTTVSAKQSTFVLRARHTSGEAWEPAIVLTSSSVHDQVTPDVVQAASRQRGGLAMVAAGDAPGAPWCLRAGDGCWTLEPLGTALVPVGLTTAELHEVHDILVRADEALLVPEATASLQPELTSRNGDHAPDGAFENRSWSLLVRLLGPVEVVDRENRPARFERSKTLELIAWLTLHRDRSTRAGARTALWDLDVRDATFANVVSEARRAMARHVEPPAGEEWLGRTLSEILPLHGEVVADVDLVRARLDHARLQPPELAIETLRPAVELIRDLPFAGTGYLWPDAEGITSNLVLAATSAASELAGHYLSMGDVDGVFWATGQGLKVLPGHEELISLRMRAHHHAGDLSGVRMEWESYERVLDADPWSDGEPAPKLVLLRRQLLSS